MSTDETYNGWSNYPTWCVNLWMGNDRGMYEAALEIAREEIKDAPDCIQVREGTWTIEQAQRFNLADHYREWIEEMGIEVEDQRNGEILNGQPNGFGADLYGWALQHVDWHEIADAWISDAVTV